MAEFKSNETPITIHGFTKKTTGEYILMANEEGCGVLVMEENKNAGITTMIDAMYVACAIKNLMFIEKHMADNTFGYGVKQNIKTFSEKNLNIKEEEVA